MVVTGAMPAECAPSAGALRIGDLAGYAGVSVDALRYYERRGLLRPSGRRPSGYREYPPEAASLVRFIKRAQALGFTLAEVEELVRLRGDARRPAAPLEAREVAAAKIRDIDERVRQLLALRDGLSELVATCEATCDAADAAADVGCPIIGALDGGDPVDTSAFPTWPEGSPDRRPSRTGPSEPSSDALAGSSR